MPVSLDRRASARTFALRAAPLALLALSLTGCTSHPVPQRPFTAFSSSAQELRSGFDRTIDPVVETTTKRSYAAIAEAPSEEALARISPLVLTAAKNADGTTDDSRVQLGSAPGESTPGEAPLFLTMERFKIGVSTLNTSIVDYSQALESLAAADVLDPATFDKMRKDLNGNIVDAAKALGIESVDVKIGSTRVDTVALFSTIATDLLQRGLEHKRRAMIAECVTDNQDDIEIAAAVGRRAVALTASSLWQNYTPRAGELAFTAAGFDLKTRRPSSGVSADQRRAAAATLVALNRTFALELDALNTIDRAYTALPAAHRQLGLVATQKESFVGAVREIEESARRLQKIYEELKKLNADASK